MTPNPRSMSMSVAEQLLKKIFWECEWVDAKENGRLVLDGSVDISEEERQWIKDFYREMQPVGAAEEDRFWRDTAAEYIQAAVAGDTQKRERLSYFSGLDGAAGYWARRALKEWDGFLPSLARR